MLRGLDVSSTDGMQFRATPHALSMQELLQFAHDIASGMRHLASLGIVHGNLAAYVF